jgi:hypothetical protein
MSTRSIQVVPDPHSPVPVEASALPPGEPRRLVNNNLEKFIRLTRGAARRRRMRFIPRIPSREVTEAQPGRGDKFQNRTAADPTPQGARSMTTESERFDDGRRCGAKTKGPAIWRGLFTLSSAWRCPTFAYGVHTIIGAEAFHCPVRNGKEWVHLAMAAKRNLAFSCLMAGKPKRKKPGFGITSAAHNHSGL